MEVKQKKYSTPTAVSFHDGIQYPQRILLKFQVFLMYLCVFYVIVLSLNQNQKGFIAKCCADLQHFEIAAVLCADIRKRQTLK